MPESTKELSGEELDRAVAERVMGNTLPEVWSDWGVVLHRNQIRLSLRLVGSANTGGEAQHRPPQAYYSRFRRSATNCDLFGGISCY
jgi:hypothetical protein